MSMKTAWMEVVLQRRGSSLVVRYLAVRRGVICPERMRVRKGFEILVVWGSDWVILVVFQDVDVERIEVKCLI